MDPTFYAACAVVIVMLLGFITFLKKYLSQRGEVVDDQQDEAVARPRQRPVAVAAGPRRRAGALNRMRETHRRGTGDGAGDDEEESEEEENEELQALLANQEGKVGAKKMKKLQEKADKKMAREAEERARVDKKKQDQLREEQRKKEEAREAEEEAKREEEEKKLKEEQEQREHEEYLKLKEAFTVEEEGTHEAELNQDVESLLQDFINYIKNMKVIMLEDLAAKFKLKTQDAVDRVQTLIAEGRLTGVIDDRGKFIYITEHEYEAVAKFIRQRGRVSITELVQSSNQLINLNPDNDLLMKQVEHQNVTKINA